MIRKFNLAFALFACLAIIPCALLAQVPQAVGKSPGKQDVTGFTSSASFEGTSDGDGQEYVLNSSVGYSFTRHLGMDLSVPFYMVRASSTVSGTSNSGIGNPALDLRFNFPSQTLNFASVVSGTAPLGDSKKGLSTGRGTFDWTNRIDHGFDNLTPFGEIGISNTVADTRLFLRPFTTLGFNTHFQGGADYDVWKFFSVGASGYAIVPSGQQTVFSKVVGSSGKSNGHHNAFENNQQTTGSADLARDHGFSNWIDANPKPYLDMELGYSHSVNYDLNAISFGISVNVGYLSRRRDQY